MIDWSRVTDLRAEIGPDCFDEIVDLFLEEAETAVAQLASSHAQQAANDLHFLKGLALNLGFSDLARLCQEMERRLAVGEVHDPAAIMAGYRASVAQFLAGLAAHAA